MKVNMHHMLLNDGMFANLDTAVYSISWFYVNVGGHMNNTNSRNAISLEPNEK